MLSDLDKPTARVTGIYSINRISQGWSKVSRAKGIKSSWFSRKTTQLILRGLRPASSAAKRPFHTFFRLPPRVMDLNLSDSNESKLTVIRFNPAFLRGRAIDSKWVPLVVRLKSFNGNWERFFTSSGSWGSKRGSPPVILIRSIPNPINNLVTRSLSSKVSRFSLDIHESPSLGMQ